ncbi:hypothetical protein WR25_23011 isoform D [Diploscapter pachys]|uniref:Major facilitator superfamily (MFS) profile domain-containing protein n=1 Tax=Diploscapter pachys TaxID=2018661 RepID=A0A2A2KYN4_9BILA|nr:hypothetical protein WR25_23011 isoform B [Diploscapter pachys]PAV79022.1 hypothetical protein WR25_23011 isoform D [Diploscapter pachys]
MFGVLVGAVVFGQISDSFGRKLATLISTFGTFVGWLLVAQSRDLFQFTATRSIVGFFTGGAISVVNVYIMENIPKKHRMWINMAITWSPNMPLLAFIAWASHSWDWFAYYNAFFCIPALLFCYFFVHESPRWLIQKGRLEEARHFLTTQLSISDHHHLIDDEFEKVLLTEYEVRNNLAIKLHLKIKIQLSKNNNVSLSILQIALQQNRKKGQYSYYHLFSTYRLMLTSIVLAFSYCSTSIINYGILFNLEKLSGSIYWNSVYTGLMRYACNLTFGYADLKFHRVGRKFVHTSGLVVVLISLAVVISAYYFEMNHELNMVITILILLASSMTSQIYIADGIVANELFPTPIRNLGYSFVQLWNRVGVIFSPIVFYLVRKDMIQKVL